WSPDGSKIAVFKADLPILTGPLVIYTMNPDGSDKQRLQAPGIISVHPAWGRAVDSDNDGTPNYLENANTSFNQEAVAGTETPGAALGNAIALPDLNHDGFLDVVAGVPGEDILGNVDAGRVVMVAGTRQGPDFSFSVTNFLPPTVNAVFFSQLTAGGRFGQTLAAGDFNGDGFNDLAIAAPGQNRVFIMLGSLGPTEQLVGNGGQFGAAMTVGDFNHDGKDDLAVGSPGEFRTTLNGDFPAGAGRAYYGGSGGLW